jgi:D-alanyl-D-alanine carboxypeptidase/D-alanyl-D-alanine-endopeptidase (penicillin-binding protein 4)
VHWAKGRAERDRVVATTMVVGKGHELLRVWGFQDMGYISATMEGGLVFVQLQFYKPVGGVAAGEQQAGEETAPVESVEQGAVGQEAAGEQQAGEETAPVESVEQEAGGQEAAGQGLTDAESAGKEPERAESPSGESIRSESTIPGSILGEPSAESWGEDVNSDEEEPDQEIPDEEESGQDESNDEESSDQESSDEESASE